MDFPIPPRDTPPRPRPVIPRDLFPENLIPFACHDRIARFFTKLEIATQEECNDRAVQLVGGKATPTPYQGLHSYTVYAGPKEEYVIQFRPLKHKISNVTNQTSFLCNAHLPAPILNLKMSEDDEDEEDEEELEEENIEEGEEGQAKKKAEKPEPPILVYIMYRPPGANLEEYIWLNGRNWNSPIAFAQRAALVKNLAELMASTWVKSPRDLIHHVNARHADLNKRLGELTKLPARFQPFVESIRQSLPALISVGIKPVHFDLRPLNLFIKQDTFTIAGVSGWANRVTGPIGLNFFFLEFLSGEINLQHGLQRYSDYDEIQEIFWRTLRQSQLETSTRDIHLMKQARILGLLLYAGFCTSPFTPTLGVAKDDGSAPLNYLLLDALLINPETRFT